MSAFEQPILWNQLTPKIAFRQNRALHLRIGRSRHPFSSVARLLLRRLKSDPAAPPMVTARHPRLPPSAGWPAALLRWWAHDVLPCFRPWGGSAAPSSSPFLLRQAHFILLRLHLPTGRPPLLPSTSGGACVLPFFPAPTGRASPLLLAPYTGAEEGMELIYNRKELRVQKA
jgi:hypothetical protein